MSEPIHLYSSDIDANPFPAYRRLRDEFPCYWSKSAGIWFLSRYADVASAAVDWETYSSLNGNLIDEIPGRSGGTLGTTDPPFHDRLRRLANHAFARKNLAEVVDHAERVARRAVHECAGVDDFDFVSSFSSKVTVDTILHMLGLPQQDPVEIRSKVVLSISTDKANKGRSAKMNEAFVEISDFMRETVAMRRREPADDLITKLAEAEIDGDALSEREIVLTTAMFVVAGVESLSSFMSIFAMNLAQMPEVQGAVREDPALMKPAIEESLRYNTSAQRFKRVLTRDVELHGKRMRKGDFVVLAYGSANRDERQFPDADNYELQRNPKGHLGFGTGKHFCIGNDFARLVMERTMNVFLEQIPLFSLDGAQLEWVPSSNFRSPVALKLVQ
ncbi:MAG: cytochrome P450 [Candidatus Puniceispirillaceae bacterium]